MKQKNDLFALFQTGLFCDVSVYCRNSDVPQDFVASGFGDFVKIKCHSLVLATFSEQLGNLLMWCAAANDTSNASDNEGNSDTYVLVLPETPASEMVKFLDQIYESLALMDEEKQAGFIFQHFYISIHKNTSKKFTLVFACVVIYAEK